MIEQIRYDGVEIRQVHYWRLMNAGSKYTIAHWQCYRCGKDIYGDVIFDGTDECPGKRA